MNTRTLPRHSRTGLLAVGWRKARPGETGPQPIWPVLGGSGEGDDPPAGDPAPGTTPAGDPPAGDPAKESKGDDEPLRPEGAKALEEWKKRAREAEKASKEQAARLKEFEDRDKSEADKLAERYQAAEERAQKATRLAVASKVEALAAASFQDPEDAVGALDPVAFVSDDGVIDTDAIKAALAELLERKPHWARETGPSRPRPDRGQGARPAGTPGIEDQIREAQAKGDWKTVMRLQNTKLADVARK